MSLQEIFDNVLASMRMMPGPPDLATAGYRINAMRAGDPVSARVAADPTGLSPTVMPPEDWLAAIAGSLAPPSRGWQIGRPLPGAFEAPRVSQGLLEGAPLDAEAFKQIQQNAKAAGAPAEFTEGLVNRLKEYNKTFKAPGHAAASTSDEVHEFVDDVVMRIGVLNTPALSGERFNRVRAVMEGIEQGQKKVTIPKLYGEPGETIDIAIPPSIRGKKVHEFYNVPSTDPALRGPRPEGFNYPIVITGNPHLANWKRPHPSWDEVITTVRVKPVHGANEAVDTAVADAINYAHEIGAKPLVTTFRSKSLWDLAKHSDIVPNNPNAPDFFKYWKPNLEPPPADFRKRPDYSPWIPKTRAIKAFRESGWDTGKNIYGKGGTWWWPRSKELSDRVMGRIQNKDGPIEYCDLLGKGCTSCRNCAKTTHPEQGLSRILGCTDEPFCGMSCPQCFVRRGQSGVGGRGSISVKPNAKQTGFGRADLGDTFSNSIGLLQGVARQQGAPVNYVSQFMRQPPPEQADMAASLYGSGLLDLPGFQQMLGEIRGGMR